MKCNSSRRIGRARVAIRLLIVVWLVLGRASCVVHDHEHWPNPDLMWKLRLELESASPIEVVNATTIRFPDGEEVHLLGTHVPPPEGNPLYDEAVAELQRRTTMLTSRGDVEPRRFYTSKRTSIDGKVYADICCRRDHFILGRVLVGNGLAYARCNYEDEGGNFMILEMERYARERKLGFWALPPRQRPPKPDPRTGEFPATGGD